MPFLAQLRVNHFRNLETVDIAPSPSFNFIIGQNGAGKSSLLEAIAFLSRGKSYRTNLFRKIIQHEKEGFLLFGVVEPIADSTLMVCGGENQEHRPLKVGIQRLRSGEGVIRINGESVSRSSELAVCFPSLTLNNVTFDLIAAGSKERRQFFDWLVFHVKHEFGAVWKDYARLLKQRNTLLRRDRIAYNELSHWDKQLVSLAHKIERMRSESLEAFAPILQRYLVESDIQLGAKSLSVEFTNGWRLSRNNQSLDDFKSSDQPLGEPSMTQTGTVKSEAAEQLSASVADEVRSREMLEELKEQFEQDCKLGYTSVGPHRSEFKVLVGRTNAGDVLSRGQQKVISSALYMSAAEVFKQHRGSAPAVMIDDLAAELDEQHRSKVFSWLEQLGCQVFLTAIEDSTFRQQIEKYNDSRVFHVKHGTIEQAAL